MQQDDPGPWQRRALSIPGVLIACGMLWALLPLLVFLGAVVDIALGRWRFGTVRLILLIGCWLAIDAAIIVFAGMLWLRFGGRLGGAKAQRLHRGTQSWWMRRIAASAQRTVGMRFEVTHRNPLGQGPIVVIARQAATATPFSRLSCSVPGRAFICGMC